MWLTIHTDSFEVFALLADASGDFQDILLASSAASLDLPFTGEAISVARQHNYHREFASPPFLGGLFSQIGVACYEM